MRRITALVLALLLLLPAAGALAEGCIGPAATTAEAALLDTPQEDGIVLMRYFIGVRVEVVREVDTRYVQVNVGEPGGSLMGYMKKEDLAFGEEAIRRVMADYVYEYTDGQTCALYSYTDTGSPVVMEACCIDNSQMLGWRSNEWLHVNLGSGRMGFVCLQELGSISERHYTPAYIQVKPTEDELSEEEAIACAKEKLLSDAQRGINSGMGMGELTEKALDACEAEVRILLYYDQPDVLQYMVTFRDAQTEGQYAWMGMLVRGKRVESYDYGNG